MSKLDHIPLKKISRDQIFNFSCPHCQYEYTEPLPEYRCYCGKRYKPPIDPYLEPHTCGEPCGLMRGSHCEHPCPLKCHSGPCPPCTITLPESKCFCGKEWISRTCATANKLSCSSPCGKKLSCGSHYCEKTCHSGNCGECPRKEERKCYCGKESRLKGCGETWGCASACGRLLDCRNHECTK